MIYKASKKYLRFWEETQNKETTYAKLYALFENYFDFDDKLTEKFKSLEIRLNYTLVLEYINYLYLVKKDVKNANRIYNQLKMGKTLSMNLQIDQKTYVKMELSLKEPFNPGNQLLILQKVGFNCFKMTGYQHQELVGMPLSILLPDFYSAIHNIHVKKKFEYESDDVAIYMKETLIKLKNNNYRLALISLKLDYVVEESGLQLYIHGFITILDNGGSTLKKILREAQKKNNYNFKQIERKDEVKFDFGFFNDKPAETSRHKEFDFLFNRDDVQLKWEEYLFAWAHNGQILEESEKLYSKIQPGAGLKYTADAFFNLQKGPLNQLQIYQTKAYTYFFIPLITFKTKSEDVIFFVKADLQIKSNQ